MSEMVLAPPNLSMSDHKYHTNHDCHNASDRPREVTLSKAKEIGLTECAICSGEIDYSGGSDKSHYNALRAAAEAQDD